MRAVQYRQMAAQATAAAVQDALFAVRSACFEAAVEHVGSDGIWRSSKTGSRLRRHGRALGAWCRINRSIRCSSHETPSASMSRHTRLAPYVRSLVRKLARTFAPSSSSLRLHWLRGRVSQL